MNTNQEHLSNISFVLYDTLERPGRILASRCPAHMWPVGSFLSALQRKDIAQWQASAETRPLFCLAMCTADTEDPLQASSEAASQVVLLSKRYQYLTGLGLMVCFHGPVDSVVRCVQHHLLSQQVWGEYLLSPELMADEGPLCQEDEATYRRLLRVTETVAAYIRLIPRPDRWQQVSWEALRAWVNGLAALMGCDAEGSVSNPTGTASLYMPQLWEVWMAMCFGIARHFSVTRSLAWTLSLPAEDESSTLTSKGEDTLPLVSALPTGACFPNLHFSTSLFTSTQPRLPPKGRGHGSAFRNALRGGTDHGPETLTAEETEWQTSLESLCYIERVASINEATVYHQVGPVRPDPEDPHVLCRGFTADMCFLRDPSIALYGDIKSTPRWRR